MKNKCVNCDREVEDWTLDRDGECSFCRAESKATDMTVGDLNK